MERRITRRDAVKAFGIFSAGAILTACNGGGSEAAPTGSPASGATPAATGGTATAAGAASPTAAATASIPPTGLAASDFESIHACFITPQQTEGPFYLSEEMVRADITEGLEGHPLRLGLRVLDASCQPLEGALVDVWHADVDGDYSAFSDGSGGAGDGGPGTTFLRGSQLTNAEGIVEFVTNYPGWYTGRAVHIHFKVHTEGGEVLTSQMYFPEDVTDEVHAGGVYASHGRRDTFNDSDGIAGDAEESGLLLAIRDDATDRGAGKLGLLVVGIGG